VLSLHEPGLEIVESASLRNVDGTCVTPKKRDDIVVFSIVRNSACSECGTDLPRGSFLRMENEQPLCLECADLDHLVYLPSGDAALTRRSRKRSTLSAIVVRFSRARKRYERQGLLVEAAALELAEDECLSDEAQRLRARERGREARGREDARFVSEFVGEIRARYPGCSGPEATTIAQHACRKYSGRIGRSAAARDLDPRAIELAVTAHVRHEHTEYDQLLAEGRERHDARHEVAGKVQRVVAGWHAG